MVDLMEHEDEPGVVLHRCLCPGFPLRGSGQRVDLLDHECISVGRFRVVPLIDRSSSYVPGILGRLDYGGIIVSVRIDEHIGRSETRSDHILLGSTDFIRCLSGSQLSQEWMGPGVGTHLVPRIIELFYLGEIHIILGDVHMIIVRREYTETRESVVHQECFRIDWRSECKRCDCPLRRRWNGSEVKCLRGAISQCIYDRYFRRNTCLVLIGKIIYFAVYDRHRIRLPSGIAAHIGRHLCLYSFSARYSRYRVGKYCTILPCDHPRPSGWDGCRIRHFQRRISNSVRIHGVFHLIRDDIETSFDTSGIQHRKCTVILRTPTIIECERHKTGRKSICIQRTAR